MSLVTDALKGLMPVRVETLVGGVISSRMKWEGNAFAMYVGRKCAGVFVLSQVGHPRP